MHSKVWLVEWTSLVWRVRIDFCFVVKGQRGQVKRGGLVVWRSRMWRESLEGKGKVEGQWGQAWE